MGFARPSVACRGWREYGTLKKYIYELDAKDESIINESRDTNFKRMRTSGVRAYSLAICLNTARITNERYVLAGRASATMLCRPAITSAG